MSLDLHIIGQDLIPDDSIHLGLNAPIDRVTALQKAINSLDGQFGLKNPAISDVTDYAAGVPTSWLRAAEAAEHMVDVVGRANMMACPDNGRFVLGGLNIPRGMGDNDYLVDSLDHVDAVEDYTATKGIMAMLNDPAADAECYSLLARSFAASGINALNNIGTPLFDRKGFAGVLQKDENAIIQDHGAERVSDDRTSDKADINAIVSQLVKAQYVLPGNVADESPVRLSGQPQENDLLSLIKRGDANGSDEFKPIENANGVLRIPQADSEGVITPKCLSVLEAVGQDGFEAIDRVFAGTSIDIGNDRAGFTKGTALWSKYLPEQALAGLGSDDLGSSLNVLYSESFFPSDPSEAAHAWFEDDPPQPPLPGLVTVPNSLNFVDDVQSDTANAAGGIVKFFSGLSQPNFDAMTATNAQWNDLSRLPSRFGNWTDTYLGIGSEAAATGENRTQEDALTDGIRFREIFDRPDTVGMVPGIEASDTVALTGREGISGASGPPGWLVALTGAVVMELRNSLFHNSAGLLGGSTAGRQSQMAPSGMRNDPLHVKLVDQPVPYQTHMPSSPSANLPSQSLPIPGQVLFSP